ncbi:hypothetical protein AAK894_05430 [Lachnospiraceae bacterium 46-61]
MGKRNKFEDVDVFASLEAIMKQNTGFYQGDLEIDKRIILERVASPNKEDKILLWLSRPSGTYCFRECDVFINETPSHNTWRFYKEQTRDHILAYAVELTGKEEGKIKGNLYELDYEKHYERVKNNSVTAGTVTQFFEYGTPGQPATQRREIQPKDPKALQSLLWEEKNSRDKLTPGDFKKHIAALHYGLIEREAQRIVADMKKLSAPNSPDKSHFMVELSPTFLNLASTKDIDRLFSMLPYKRLAFSQIKNSYGTYALIGKDENRDRQIKKPRPSVRAQLAQDKKRTAPKKAAAKTKNHGLEV